jgi:hypothetical protein
LELETQRQQDLMLKTLGPASEVVRRREERILVLRKIDQKLADITNAITRQLERESEPPSSDLCPGNAAAHPEWMIDKDVWLSSSSLDLRLEADKQGHSVLVHFYTSCCVLPSRLSVCSLCASLWC